MQPILTTTHPNEVEHRKRIAESLNAVLKGQVSLPGLALVDGITEPAARGDGATLFIDSADGDLKVKFSDGTVIVIVRDSPLTGSVTIDFGSIAAGGLTTTNVTVTGAVAGDPVAVGCSISPAGLYPYAQVSAANTVSVGFFNYSSGAVNPASATFTLKVFS